MANTILTNDEILLDRNGSPHSTREASSLVKLRFCAGVGVGAREPVGRGWIPLSICLLEPDFVSGRYFLLLSFLAIYEVNIREYVLQRGRKELIAYFLGVHVWGSKIALVVKQCQAITGFGKLNL